MDRVKSEDWIKEASTYTEQGYVLIEEKGSFWWVR